MNGQSKDRRVRKTKKALQISLAKLMATKNIRDITVQELSDEADLNRATFYLHYRDIFDLQQQIEDEVVEELETILNQYMPGPNQDPYPLFVTLLNYIKENATLCGTLLSDNSNHSFLNKLCAIVESQCLDKWLQQQRFDNEEEILAYFSTYIIHGYTAVIAKWARTGMTTPPETMATMIGNMGLYGVGYLDQRE